LLSFVVIRAKVDSQRLRERISGRNGLAETDDGCRAPFRLLPLIDDNSCHYGSGNESQIPKAQSGQGIGLIVVDYIQLMRSSYSHDSVNGNIGYQPFAEGFGQGTQTCPLWRFRQLNRQVESRTTAGRRWRTCANPAPSNRMPMSSLLSTAMSLYKSDDNIDKGTAEDHYCQQRNGPTDTASLVYRQIYKLENLSRVDAPEA